MYRNRFFKTTYGVGGEFVIATTIDNSATPAIGVAPSSGVINLGLAASPTAGDKVTMVVGGQHYDYIVLAGDTTAATLNTSIKNFLNTNTQGFTVTSSGTTSSVFTLAAPVGTSFNGVVVTAAAGTPNAGPTFSAISTSNFGTGGTNAVSAGPAATLKDFTANAAAGALGVYWFDTQTAVAPSSTQLFANVNRSFFYAWKTQDGNTMTTSPIKCNGREYRTTAYNAGVVDIWTLALTGTVTAGQYLHVRIQDLTSEQIPFPSYEYTVQSTGTINTDIAALRDLINGENAKNDPIVTATASTNTLTVTGKYNSRRFQLTYFLETVGSTANAMGLDASIGTLAHTQSAVMEVGTTADVKEFEKYFKIQNGVMIYVSSDNGLMTPDEFNSSTPVTSNVVAATQYGYFVVTHRKEHRFPSAALPYNGTKAYTVVAIPSTLLNQLAGY